MPMLKHVKNFLSCEQGAITVDFVVLTASICTLGAIVAFMVFSGAKVTMEATSDALSTATLAPIGPL